MLKSLYMSTRNSGRCIFPSLWPKNAIIAHIFHILVRKIFQPEMIKDISIHLKSFTSIDSELKISIYIQIQKF